MLEGLRKIDGSKNYYTSADGRVFSVKEIRPYVRCSKKYYKIIGEDCRRMYYTVDVVKTTTQQEDRTNVVKTTTEKVVAPKKKFTKEEISSMIF